MYAAVKITLILNVGLGLVSTTVMGMSPIHITVLLRHSSKHNMNATINIGFGISILDFQVCVVRSNATSGARDKQYLPSSYSCKEDYKNYLHFPKVAIHLFHVT